MTEKEIKEELKSILPNGHLTIQRRDNELTIEYSDMYSRPALDFKTQMKLYKLFESDQIVIDGYDVGGCDTCGYGGNHAHQISISEIPISIIESIKDYQHIEIK